MHKTLTPIRGRLFLFAALACALCALPKASQGSPQNPPQNTLLPEDSSKHKTRIVGCANFGQVNCDSANGGGISGYADATGLFQCINTGNIAGDRKIGGIAGYASGNSSDSGEIGHCLNSGLIQAGNSSGGLIGYSNRNLRVFCGYNIGNVTAGQSAGAIVGRQFHTDASFRDCYYDRQSCLPGAIEGQDSPASAEGLFTRQMTGDSLRPVLGNAFWHFHSDRYPTPQRWDSLPEVMGATSPVLFNGNQRLDSVADRFSLYSPQGMYWRSDDSGSVRIVGNEGIILKADSNRMLFIGDGNGIFRQVPLLRTWRSVCHKVAFHANQGNGQMDTLEVCGNQPAILPAPLFSRTHYLFQGWAYSGNGGAVLQSGDTLFCTQDTTLYAVWSPDGSDSAHAIPINNHLELMAFRNAVNNYSKGVFKGIPNQSTGFRGIHFMLTADMDLDSLHAAGTDWEPVGKSSSASFRGQFHGMGHSISNLYINTPTANYKGLFGYLDSALVEDVTLSPNDTIIGKQYCGGIAAYANNGSRILRCASHAYVEGASTHIGGICGNLAKSDIADCYNTGSVTGSEKVGGLAGYTNGSSARYSHILRGSNSGQISATKAAGGICGNSYSYTEIRQVCHNGQVWADTLSGSIVGLKSQKTVSFQYAYYDIQISPTGAINGTDDSNAAGYATAALTDSLPYGFDTRYWQQYQGNYPLLASAVTDTAALLAATPIRLAQGENVKLVSGDFTFGGCGWIQWSASPSTNLQISQCTAHITGSDSNVVLTASYRQFRRQIRIVRLQLRTRCNIRLWANDSSNNHIVLQAYKDSYLTLDTVPFQLIHHILRGWSFLPQGNAMLAIGDSILVQQDTSLYAMWGNDGLSSEYALRIDNLNDWVAFRDAVNDYANGCYQGIHNRNSGYCGIHFALYAPIDLRTVCDSAHAWTPVGRNSSTPFRGNFEGNGHTIDYMVIDSAGMDFAGLFGCIDSATISGLEVGSHSRLRGRRYVGGITGCARNSSSIRQCANHAPITGGEEYIGGICGYLSQSAIRECYNAANIRGTEKVGGIVGYAGTASAGNGGSSALGSSNVSYCYNSHAVLGSQCTGGLIGFANGNTALSRSYNSGQLFGTLYTGSIVGRKYSSQTSISRCVYDRQICRFGGINGKDPEAATEGRLTLQMTDTLLQPLLDTLHWRYTAACYPQLQAMESSPAAWVSVLPIFLSGEENADSIAHDFALGSHPGCWWESGNPSVLRIEGFKATLLDSDTLSIIVHFDSACAKRIDIRTIPEFTTHTTSMEQSRPECLLYPNPVTNQLNIRIPENNSLQQVYLFDASGKLLLKQAVTKSQFNLDLTGLPAGVYRLVLYGKEHKNCPFTIFKQ